MRCYNQVFKIGSKTSQFFAQLISQPLSLTEIHSLSQSFHLLPSLVFLYSLILVKFMPSLVTFQLGLSTRIDCLGRFPTT